MAERGGGYPGLHHGRAASGGTEEERFDYPRTVWYKIPLFQKSECTNIEFDPEICKVLEWAYQTGKDRVTFKDKNTGSNYTANLRTCTVYMNGNFTAHACLERGIFGVPKQLCAQMYARGVAEYSKTYGLQSVKKIHFVDTISEMCQLTQLAFDKELQFN